MGALTCYLSSAACHFHPVLGHCSSRRRQLKPWVFGNWKPSTSSLLLPAHSEKVNLWLDNMMWSHHSTAKASLSPSCGKSRSACHVAVAVHRRWWSLEQEKQSLEDWKRTWLRKSCISSCVSFIPLCHSLMLVAWWRVCEWESRVNLLILRNYSCCNECVSVH